MKNTFVNWFHFSRPERNGTILLCLLSCLAAGLAGILPGFQQPMQTDSAGFEAAIAPFFKPVEITAEQRELFYFDPNTASKAELLRLGVPEKTALVMIRYREKGGRFKSAADLGKIYGLPAALASRLGPWVQIPGAEKPKKEVVSLSVACVPFDPNTAADQLLLQEGIPPGVVQRILHFREKGGRFRVPADLAKMYGMPEDCFNRLAPYIDLASVDVQKNAAVSSPKTAYPAYVPKPRIIPDIDINQADADTWQQLPGIGAARAAQILRYRDRLGGFSAPRQVAETFGLPDSVYQRIAPYLRASPLYRQIDINAVSEQQLATHPYFSFRQARLIIAYRDQHGPFHSSEELLQIPPLRDENWLEKIKPYLVYR